MAALNEAGKSRLADAHRRSHHDAQHPILGFDIRMEDVDSEAETGVVDDHVDGSVAVGDPCFDRAAAIVGREIGWQHFDVYSPFFAKFTGEEGQPFVVARDDHQVVAECGEPAGESRADSGAGTGDESGRHAVTLGCRSFRLSAMPRPALVPRLRGLGTTIFAEMTALALATDSINLGQGFPDVDGPSVVTRAAIEAIAAGRNQYAPGDGAPELRAAIMAHQKRFYGISLDDSQVIVTAGATEAVAAALLAMVDTGDEVIALEPYYDSYAAGIAMAGGVRVPVTLRPPSFRLSVDALRAAVTPRTKLILLNTPHNPTGMMLSLAELQAVADVAISHDLIVVTDEVYEHLVYDGTHVPLSTLPGMFERTLTISSAGKTFGLTGWKVGWATGPAELVSALRTTKQFMTYTNAAPLQPAIALGLRLDDGYYSHLAASLRRKRDLLCAGLASIGFEVFKPAATYFVTADISPLGYSDGMEFCRALPGLAGVVAIPHSVFYDSDVGKSLVRFAFCKRDEVLVEAISRMRVLASSR